MNIGEQQLGKFLEYVKGVRDEMARANDLAERRVQQIEEMTGAFVKPLQSLFIGMLAEREEAKKRAAEFSELERIDRQRRARVEEQAPEAAPEDDEELV